jgi:probable rRNA maturation factor
MIEINNLTSAPIDKSFFKKVVRRILRKEKKEKLEPSIILINQRKIKELNKKYRGENRSTDVLAFSEVEFPKSNQEIKNSLGEIIICPQEVKKNSKRFKTTFKKEITNCLIHGILHLLGYDHEDYLRGAKLMEKKQKYYFSRIFNQR